MSADRRIRVFHCDDSEPFTELVRQWLLDAPDLVHVGAAHEPNAARQAIPAARPDVVLLDTMTWASSRLTVGEVRDLAPGVHVILYSGYPRQLAEKILEGSGELYLKKSEGDAELLAAIRSVAEGA